MDLNLLSLFITVAEAPNFTAAASALGLKRSSVSRGIATLERSLGVQLFNRSTRHVALTTAGTALYAKVAPQLSALKQAMGSLPEREEQPSGELRVAAPNDFGGVVLPRVLAGFTLRYPAVRVDVRLSHRIVDLVQEGIDLALRISMGPLKDSSLVARRLGDFEAHIYASPAYLARAGVPRIPPDTRGHRWASFRGIPLPRSFPQLPSAQVIGDDIMFVLRAVRTGVGLGVLPTFVAQEDVAAGTLVRVLPKISLGAGRLSLVHPPARHVPRKVAAFRDYLVEFLARNPLAGR